MSKSKKNPFDDIRNFLLYPGVFFLLLAISIIVHEIGHAIAALLKGVRPDELVIRWYGVGPGVTVPNTFPMEYLPFFRYAGGTMAALIFFLIYLIFSVYPLQIRTQPVKWFNFRWWTEEFILLWAIFQLINGYIEGARFQQYVTDPTTLQSALIIAIPISLIAHSGVTIVMRKIRRQDP